LYPLHALVFRGLLKGIAFRSVRLNRPDEAEPA
jgi:hypothetical protein